MIKDNFINYINNFENEKKINKKYDNYISNLSDDINNIPNIILYGPPGSGKYSEALKIVLKYSATKLKYEKKMIVKASKNEHIIKISDIHYEIDMENLTCNSKLLFNDIYKNIVDVIESSKEKKGIILCKNYHNINSEIIDIFYSYMQKNLYSNIVIKFILLTENISFIPENIKHVCKILYYSKLSVSNYIKLSNSYNKKLLLTNKNSNTIINNLTNINTLKYINLTDENINFLNLKQKICDSLVNIIIKNNTDYNYIRNLIYDLLIYNLNIGECIYYIINNVLLNKKEFTNSNIITDIMTKTCIFLKYYNNNYRPIYHLESYILYLIKIYNET